MEDHINEVVSDAEIATNNQNINVLYYRPKFTHRIFANLLDILIITRIRLKHIRYLLLLILRHSSNQIQMRIRIKSQ